MLRGKYMYVLIEGICSASMQSVVTLRSNERHLMVVHQDYILNEHTIFQSSLYATKLD